MRLARAIERFLAAKQLERDFTARTHDSYYRDLNKLVDAYPDMCVHDFDGREGKRRVMDVIAARWGSRSARTRAKVISEFHSFFKWLEAEDLIENDRVRLIERPRARRPDVYRPPTADVEAGLAATTVWERAPWLLISRVGLRNSEMCGLRWRDVDLRQGEVHMLGKGQHRDVLPIDPQTLGQLRAVYRELAPDPDHHVFTVEVELWEGPGRIRVRRDPTVRRPPKTLWRMVRRVCKRAGIREFGAHALRHSFAVAFLRDSGRDIVALQPLMRHASLETTRGYLDDLKVDDLREVLARVAEVRTSDANPDTGEGQDALPLADESWRRGELNPRPGRAGTESQEESDSDPDLAPPDGTEEGSQGAV